MLMRISGWIAPGAQRLTRSAPAQRPLPARRPSLGARNTQSLHVLEAISTVIRPANWAKSLRHWRPAAREALRAIFSLGAACFRSRNVWPLDEGGADHQERVCARHARRQATSQAKIDEMAPQYKCVDCGGFRVHGVGNPKKAAVGFIGKKFYFCSACGKWLRKEEQKNDLKKMDAAMESAACAALEATK